MWRRIALALVFALLGAVYASGDVYYEIFVRSFQDSDADGIGDFEGVIQRLDYLEDLGITGIWLMPIHPSPSYHGYDVTDYYQVNPDYGSLEDFKALLREAHARGMEVIIDLVVNHTSDQHPWFIASCAGDETYRGYYLWSETQLDWLGTGGTPAWHDCGGDYYLGLFWSGMPDLNYRNPAVVREMERVAGFWLDLGVDGFRVDAIQHIVESTDGLIRNTPDNLAWVKDFETFIKSVDPEAFIVGETWTDVETISRYFTEADLNMAFAYPQFLALMDAIKGRNTTNLELTLTNAKRFYPEDAALGTFISNHDQIRPATSLSPLLPKPERNRLAAGLLLTLPGTPFLYYGEEIGMPNGPGDRDEEKRTPMRWDNSENAGFTTGIPWYTFSTEDPAITVAAQKADPDSLLNWYERLIDLRKDNPALSEGDLTLLEPQDSGVLAFLRSAEEERVLVLANVTSQEKTLSLPSLVDVSQARDLLMGEVIGEEIVLKPLELRVLELPPGAGSRKSVSGFNKLTIK